LGSFGLFFTAFLLFARCIPFVAISEVKAVRRYGRAQEPVGDREMKVWTSTRKACNGAGGVFSARERREWASRCF
jgi:hypothetical protein